MTLYFKVGSGPGSHMKIVRKRKPPSVGERFLIKNPHSKFSREQSVRLIEVRDLGTHLMYMVEKF